MLFRSAQKLEHQQRPHMVVDGHATDALWMGRRPACWRMAPNSYLLHADHGTWVWNATTRELTALGSSCYVGSIEGLGAFVVRPQWNNVHESSTWQLLDFNPMTGKPRVVWQVSDKTHMPIVIGQRDGNPVVKLRNKIITLVARDAPAVTEFPSEDWNVVIRGLSGDAVRGQYVLLYRFDDARLPKEEQLKRWFEQREFNVELAVLHLKEGTIRKIGVTPGQWIRTPGDGGMASRYFHAEWISAGENASRVKDASKRLPLHLMGTTTYVSEQKLKLLTLEQD